MNPAKNKLLFILNPKAGTGSNNRISGYIDQIIDTGKFEYEIIFSQYAGHGIELSRNAAAKNYFAVVAVGGDGTINEIAQSLAGTGTALAILPRGSGNGFARHIKIPMNTRRAIPVINKGKTTIIDTFTVNDQFALNISGIGFDAHIADLFSRAKTRGFKTYFRLTVKEYFRYSDKNVSISVDGKKTEEAVFIAAFANSSQWGNNARIAPLADIQDGLLDISIIKKMPLYKMVNVISRLFRGKLKANDYIKFYKGKEFIVTENKEGISLHIDGEPRGVVKELKIKIEPASLKVIVP